MKRSAGFTLLEVLVALAVLAVALGAIIHAVTQSIGNVAALREQTFAGWVALNKVNAFLLDVAVWPDEGSRKGTADLANRTWRWEARFSKTADPDLRRLELTVHAVESGPVLNQLVAFQGRASKEASPENQAANGQPAQDQPAKKGRRFKEPSPSSAPSP